LITSITGPNPGKGWTREKRYQAAIALVSRTGQTARRESTSVNLLGSLPLCTCQRASYECRHQS